MSKNYVSIEKNRERRAKNKKAFYQTIEVYALFKTKSLSVKDLFSNSTTPNPAKPSPTDFICDVENQIKIVMKTKKELTDFMETYIMGMGREGTTRIEQRIGQLFISREIWPIARYFKTIRRKQTKV